MEKNKHEQHITRQLRILFKTVQLHAKKVEKACGLSSAKIWMLHEISANSGLKVSELAGALSIHPSTCSNMLDKLEDMQLIARDRSRSDQRSVHLSLTEKGQNLLVQAPIPHQGELNTALAKLSETQLLNLETGLDDLLQALKIEDSDAAMVPIVGE
ncbi:MarR family winged helix-turn-helix transcriptional regulator [Desulfopila aestuarii]|uniref:DNA-binding transcriptional regulator, MarR family n=1 Tax=Desulfopila aestuarii DSM 18488 TaxID=1121416 RepID=A0A1M7YJC6_9BACT|nr:MarR family transcriptional regulator [Desulfopila aestuarii]SHO52712.1 DNA-binding transcriptional regulator, MarR family [Desulfopila aestuarii DSM 18488]